MKAVRVHPGGGVIVQQVAEPELLPGTVIVRVEYGGICGSDLHYAMHGRNGDYEVIAPLTLGHEIAGTVARVASDVAGIAVGAPVTVHPAQPCAPAGAEPTGLHLLRTSYLGSASTRPHTQGGFANLVAVRADQVRVLPPGLSTRRAALAEPLAVALHAASLAGDVRGRRVLVIGAGPIGLLTILALSGQAPIELVAADLSTRALDLSREVGATATIHVPVDAPGPESFDVVVEASGAAPAIRSAFESVKPGGTIVQLAIPASADIATPTMALLTKEITLRGAWRFDTEIDDAVQVLAAHPEADKLITHEFDIEDAVEAFSIAADPALSSKVVLRIS